MVLVSLLLPQDNTLALLRLMGSTDNEATAGAGSGAAAAASKRKPRKQGVAGKDQREVVEWEEDVDGGEAVGSLAAKLSELSRRLLQVCISMRGPRNVRG